MKTIQPTDKLNRAIQLVKQQNAIDYLELRTSVKEFNEKITPSNIIKDAIEKWTSPFVKDTNELKSIFAPILGILTQKVVAGKSSNPLKILMGYGAELVVNQVVNKYLNKNTP